MKKFDSISVSSKAELPHARSYLLLPGIVLFASVLTISNAQARDMYRVAPIEVVVYEGAPIDYSNQRDVIVIDESSSRSSYSNVILVQDYTDESIEQPQAVAYQKPTPARTHPQAVNKPQSKPLVKPFSKPRATQAVVAKAKPAAVNNKRLIAKHEQKPVTKTAAPKANANDAALMAFYANVMKSQKKKLSSRPTPLATMALKKTSTKNVVQKSPTPSNAQLTKLASKSKVKQYTPTQVVAIKGLNKAPNPKLKGKDPQLVAFYMDVFGKQKKSLSKQTTRQAVKQIVAKKRIKNKSKINYQSKKVQLAKVTSTSKDPELVAFYKQVFGNEVNSSSKHAPTVVNSNTKDPELVAFYEREFGKSMSKAKVVAKTTHKNPKIKIVSNSKPEKKRSVKKVKSKSKNATSTAAVELQKLIDDLTNKNII
ncbi:hypothetical protein OO007_10625 [Cocleimonas sp. KMM 6892]|uniref:hypothetical protein n=1 Tax=unclassified Cocleimonas TaxID=2639732 RepID=UPI002DB5FCF2|nr:MULTISPECIES: hypothetical protein [unclassified Cocleimonas]MEB8432681.1 hypothetical protein [Cocleimonas sp. KMM 6892]MEC4715540.1 hypothetical protein [Cocleimonas sp. KMM 6895]MEC4744842.1 hypothetical protein [Cocleimonas sp. KMM 6896]